MNCSPLRASVRSIEKFSGERGQVGLRTFFTTISTLAKDFPDRDYLSPNNNQISEDVKRIWGFLCDYLEEYPAFTASVQDLANYPNDKDFIGAFRAQVKKYLKEDQVFARDVDDYFRTL